VGGRRRIGGRRGEWHRGLLIGAEPVRAATELVTSTVLLPLLALQPRGDGHCVLVLPGWLASDRSTLPLRRYVKLLGYDVRGWDHGRNRGATVGNVAALQHRLAELAKSSGRSVSVIGWSLGGHFAYQLARRNPANVRQVITLGSPAATQWLGSKAVSRMADRLAGGPVCAGSLPRPWNEDGPLRTLVTAIHSRSDPIVAWRTSLVRPARKRQDVEVHGSHIGMAYNPAVLHVIADRLSQNPEHWKPFRPTPLLRPLFPSH
jgi:pimeloyl-ACP methyl ester carboxylesterase